MSLIYSPPQVEVRPPTNGPPYYWNIISNEVTALRPTLSGNPKAHYAGQAMQIQQRAQQEAKVKAAQEAQEEEEKLVAENGDENDEETEKVDHTPSEKPSSAERVAAREEQQEKVAS